MDLFRIEDMYKGWFAGDFEPTSFKTKDFEACWRIHPKGEKWDHHYHKVSTEINLLVKGKMILQGKELNSGDIFILHPYEIADPEFLEDCEIVCIKTPSSKNDKYTI